MLWEHVKSPGGRNQGRDQRGTNPLGGRCGSGSEAPSAACDGEGGANTSPLPREKQNFRTVSYAMELSRVHETTVHLGNGSHGSVCSVTL